MLNKNVLIILFLILHLTNSLKTSDLCILNEQHECKGSNDLKKNYQTKCNKIKCHGTLSYECGLNFCSKSVTECSDYNHMKLYYNMLLEIYTFNNLKLASQQVLETNKISLFNRHIKDCENKFDSNEFCVNGKNCTEIRKVLKGFSYHQITKQIDCVCPVSQSIKCGKFCTIDSNACDYLNENKKHFKNIKDCGNQNVVILRTYKFF
jgi:hypothetical protein